MTKTIEEQSLPSLPMLKSLTLRNFTAFASKPNAVFKPDELGRFTRRDRRGRQSCEVSCLFSPSKHPMAFSFNTAARPR
jgi:hypothetical protein